MFFYINGYTDLLPEVEPGIHLDLGWRTMEIGHCKLYYKGYTDKGNLEDQVNLIYYGARPSGIWTVIEQHSDGHVLITPKYRPYPLYKQSKVLTNTYQSEWEEIPTLLLVEEIPTEKITLDQAAVQILDILKENIQNILDNNKLGKPRMIFSGGIDSLCLWAVLDSMTTEYELWADVPNLASIDTTQDIKQQLQQFHRVKRTYSTPLIESITNKYWGYELTSIDSIPTANIVGFWGDEVMLRNPDHIDILAKTKGSTAKELVKPDDYMYKYLMKSKYELSSQYTRNSEAIAHSIIKMWLSSDFQMWHLDEHIHYSPYFDIRIYKVMRKLSVDDIIQHGLTACIQRKIIDLVNPKFNLLLSDQKNTEFNFENYSKNKHEIPHILDKLVK